MHWHGVSDCISCVVFRLVPVHDPADQWPIVHLCVVWSCVVQCPLQESVLAAELVLATLLETARVGDAGPATVARNAAGRLDTPGAGHVPGDTPWPRREPGTHLGWEWLTEASELPLDLQHDMKQVR